jgi:hypothetical protein
VCLQGITVGSELVRINNSYVSTLEETALAKLVAKRPATYYFRLAVEEGGRPLPFEFDASPTGLQLHWDEDEGIVRVSKIVGGSQAERLVRLPRTHGIGLRALALEICVCRVGRASLWARSW